MRSILDNQLLGKEMSRKQFFQHVAVMILMVAGVTNLLNSLKSAFKMPDTKKAAAKPAPKGFGSSKFGV